MRVSPAGRAAITQREGCKLVAYRDSKGIPTIGVGHVDMTPPKTVMGMRITKEQADTLLAADLAPVEATIARAVRVPMSQNECDALASLGFNIGVSGLARSTVVARLNRGDRAGAAQAFLMWAHPPELMGRRRAEARQFVTPDVSRAPVPIGSAPVQAHDKLVVVSGSTAPAGAALAVAPQPVPVTPAAPAKLVSAPPAPPPAPTAAPTLLATLASSIGSFFSR